jgi:hypothetical protein
MQLNQFPNRFIALIHDSNKKAPIIEKQKLGKTDIPAGYGAFFTVNGFDKERKKNKLTHVSGVFADIDQKEGKMSLQELQQVLFEYKPPSIINETKNGYHCIWLLEESIGVTDDNRDELIATVEGIHRRFVDVFKADNAAIDVGHLLRIPRTEHRKNPAEPFVITTVYETDDVYTLDELVAEFPPILKPELVVEYGETSDDIQTRLERMLEKPHINKLWSGDVEEDKQSETDQSLCNHLAFWLAKDPTAMEQAWLSSPKGQRSKVQERADYRKLTIDKAIANTSDVYTPKQSLVVLTDVNDIDMETLMYVVKNKGKENEYKEYLANDENIIRILNHYKMAKYDSFTNRAFLRISGQWIMRDDGVDGRVFSWLVNKFPFLAKSSVRKVAELLTFVQYRNVYDSAQDYVNSLKWDGVSRLDTWLPRVFFVEDDSYYRDIGSKWFMGMVARILQPGCKFDNALVVHGGQKIGKSSVFLIIAGEDSHIEFTDLKVREMQQDMQGKLIVEFAEAAIFSKADSESLKSIISRQTDTFRIPYERHAKDFPRRCVFAVTANNDDILKDSTGGRRWWAVDVPDDMKCYPPKRQADIHWLRENRDQLFAEAVVRVRNGEDFRNIDEYELIKRQKSITATEQDEDLFFDWYHSLGAGHQNEGVSGREAYVGAYKKDHRGDPLDITSVSIKKADEMRVGRILKKLGLEKKKSNGQVLWVPGEMFDRDYRVKLQKTIHEYKEW